MPATPSVPCSACSPPPSGWCRSSVWRAPQWCARRSICCAQCWRCCLPRGRRRRRDRRRRMRPATALCAARRSPACSASATKCWSCACSARWPRTPSTPSRSCWPCTSSARRGGAAAYQRWLPGVERERARLRDRLMLAAGGGLPARQHCAWRRAECAQGLGAARPRRQHGGGAGRRSGARHGGLSAADHRHGRTVQPPEHARACTGHRLRTRARHQYAGRCRRAAAVRRAAGAGASGPKFALLLVVAGYLLLVGRARAWLAPGAGRRAIAASRRWLGAAAGLRRRSRGRATGQLRGRRHGRRSASCEDADGVASLHINNRQQEGSSAHPARRCPAGAAAAAAAPGAAARTVPRPGHRRHRVRRRPRTASCRSTRSSCCRKSSTRRRTSRASLGAEAPSPRLHVMTADARRYVRAAASAMT